MNLDEREPIRLEDRSPIHMDETSAERAPDFLRPLVMEIALLTTPELERGWDNYVAWCLANSQLVIAETAFRYAYLAGFAQCLALHHPALKAPREQV